MQSEDLGPVAINSSWHLVWAQSAAHCMYSMCSGSAESCWSEQVMSCQGMAIWDVTRVDRTGHTWEHGHIWVTWGTQPALCCFHQHKETGRRELDPVISGCDRLSWQWEGNLVTGWLKASSVLIVGNSLLTIHSRLYKAHLGLGVIATTWVWFTTVQHWFRMTTNSHI